MANGEPCRTGSASGAVEEGEGAKEVSLKRKKLPSVSDSAASPAPTDQPEQRSYASVVKHPEQEPSSTSEPAPSSAALGNLAKANGKRLKLDIKSNMEQGTTSRTPDPQPAGLLHGEKVPIVRSKPPIPPKPAVPANRARKQQIVETQNAHTVQKLLAQNEQMRLELSDLRSSLAAERNAVRSLRAQNESDLRKTKAECKKLQEALQHHKRNVATQQCQSEQRAAGAAVPAKRAHRGPAEQQEWLPGGCSGPDSRQQHQQGLEVLKLNQENSALRETNKFLEEKYQISSEAERRKAADIRVQRDLYELRLTQLSKSAKNEIQRLLEELKSKERTIGQLKKELQQQQQAAATAAAVGPGGGCRKERKAAKNSAQQSHEMRKLRETETGSGTISKCNSNNSIQSVNDDYEQLEAKESLELTIVTATTTTTAAAPVPAAEVVSTAIDRDYCPVTTYRKATRTADLLEIENTTTYGNDVPEQAALPYELCKRTMEAHDDEGSSASSVETKRQRHCVLVHQDALAYEEREADGRASTKATTPPIDCQQQLQQQQESSLDSEPDSALSSMSPQPNSFTGEAPENDPWNVQQQGCSRVPMAARDETKLARIKLELDEMQHRYESLNRDYTAAKDQIDQLEQELVKATQASREQTKLNERIDYLVQREEELLKESHELREQNELLEFRIIELEESHDKWSLRSPNSSPTVGGGGGGVSSGGSVKTDGWTDTEKEHDHELIMLSERSDSGVTSPNSHHHLEDPQSGVPSPCDLSLLDQIPTDDVRKRLIAMTKRTCYDEEDKLCMLQILSLLNNLEALSQDHEIAGDDMSLGTHPEMPVPKYNYTLPESSTPPKALLHHQPPPSSTPYKTGRIVATVQPFHSTDRLDRATSAGGVGDVDGESPMMVSSSQPKSSLSIASIAETFGGMKKTTRWNNSASLQESGVFVDEPSCTQATQTELEDFPSGLEKTNAELCAEIEKLNRFREKIEECKGVGTPGGGQSSVSSSGGAKPVPVALHLPAATGDEECDRRRLQYYVERAESLENKLKVYESSGEQQVRALADRLQRELQLESWVKQLSEKVNQLELDNERLEEERCELEEVENDTRLRLQRLEEDLEVMGQRSVELEMSRSSYQSKYQDAKTTIVGLEELVQKYEEKVFLLEESENDLRERIELIYMFIPMLLLYNSWQLHEQFRQFQRQRSEERTSARSTAIQCLPLERMEESYYEANVSSSTSSMASGTPDDLQTRLSELMKREKELTQNIAELNRAYNETLENADNLWAQMEREYKEKIGRCEQEEQTLKAKIAQLEERLTKDSEYASERIAHLEETEHGLKARISRLSKENKELSAKHGGLLEEYGALKEDYTQLQNYLRGPAAEALEREKKRVLALEDELAHTVRTLRDGEESHRAEVGTLRGRLLAATKELNHIEVTNSELREEVETLEARIRELMTLRTRDDEKIKHLSEELESKQSQLLSLQHGSRHGPATARSVAGRSLAQELERPLKGGSYTRHSYEQQQQHQRRFPDSDGSGSEEKSKFPSTRPLSMSAFETKEVKSLAETIILNAESSRAGAKTPKKSFVEEISN